MARAVFAAEWEEKLVYGIFDKVCGNRCQGKEPVSV